MKLIVGLGNPGKKYELTKHNIGFLIVDQLADEFGHAEFKEKNKVQLTEGTIKNEKVLFVKPQTFMNLSGHGVAPIANFYKIEPQDILIIYDDLDLEFGSIRLRKKGGAGGHNGMKSLIQMLGTEEFLRLKVGIGRPPQGWQTADYVLSRFTDEEWPAMENAIKKSVKAVTALITEGIDQAMNNYN
ncbi:MAG: aminoacyl-tRNA hydrolase [Bacillota bacterium]|nr:aminoacyl-tRNA hydrolase [Bacillota bacterium]